MGTMYVIDGDQRVTLAGLRKLASRNGIIDALHTDASGAYVMDARDIIETILDCFPDVETIKVED